MSTAAIVVDSTDTLQHAVSAVVGLPVSPISDDSTLIKEVYRFGMRFMEQQIIIGSLQEKLKNSEKRNSALQKNIDELQQRIDKTEKA